MRVLSLVLLALASLLPPRPAAGGMGLLVAQLAGPAAAPARGTSAAPADARALRARVVAALGLELRRGLLDGLPAATGLRPLATDAPFDRIVLLEAADSAAADAASARLVDQGLADWVEPVRMREAAVVSLRGAAPAGVMLLDSLANDPLLAAGRQWGLWNPGAAGGGFFGGLPRADAHALEGWRRSVGSDDVRLAVADTGIDPAQPELGGLLADGRPRIVFPLDAAGDPQPSVIDSFGHGTPVAGVMAARTNDGPRIDGNGVAGVCGGDGLHTAGCSIVPIKVTQGLSGEASSFAIARAILHATMSGARAMNLSFAGTHPSRVEQLALQYAITHGCVVVAAAGNNGARANPRQPMYPAAYSVDGLCIEVGASDESDARTVWSSYGPGVDLVAPGTNVWTTFMTYPSAAGAVYDGYCIAAGTSFAAPFVTGAVGLLAAARPELTDTDFQHVLRESAVDVGAPGVDEQTGWGRLDLGRALDAVRPTVGIWHDEVAADHIAPDTTSGTLVIGDPGPGTLDRWSGSVAAQRWLVSATVAVPDSFVDSIRVWTRVGGTLAARGDYRLPYFTPAAQVEWLDTRHFQLRGWIYQALDSCAGCPEPWIPLPPDYARFGFTVLGRVDRSRAQVPPGAHGPRALAAGPNPFRDAVTLHVPGAGRVTVMDGSGRVRRTFDVAGPAPWDGRDDAGRRVAPGLYFVRWRSGGETRLARIVKLERGG